MGRFFAVPQGAKVSFKIKNFRSMAYQNMNIAPQPNIQDDNDDSPPIYEKDRRIYSRNAYYPASPVMVSGATNIRGVDASIVNITPFQYNPVTLELLVYTDIEVQISFISSSKQFGENRLRSRFFDPILKQHLINYDQLPEMDYSHMKAPATLAKEAEYVIIIPNSPLHKKYAEIIKEHRIRQGITTEVYSLAQIGSSVYAIKNWIHNAVKFWKNPPVAVLLMADAGNNPSMHIPVPKWSYTPSDNIYADVYNNDSLPDIVITRMTGRNATELGNMVDKMFETELHPPAFNYYFYNEPVMAVGWQSDRWFLICAEVVTGYFSKIMGKTPAREYTGSSGPPSYWSTNKNTHMLVDYFGPSGLDYIPTTPSHLTDWGGNSKRIIDDINRGAFFALHRDHGSPSGWSHPSFTMSDLSKLTNVGAYPYVFSINCSTGAFAGSGGSDCFAEEIHRIEHGAVGCTAASGTSYSFVNDTFVFGMVDSMFPDFDPGYGGSTGSDPLRPGFANMSGKYYLEASNWPYNTSSKEITYHLFHAHTEPFLTIFSEPPKGLSVTHASTMPINAPTFTVTADAGSFIALTVEEEAGPKIVGTKAGTGGPVSVTITPLVSQARIMTVTVTKPNHLQYQGTVYIPHLGSVTEYGTGLAGSGGHTPHLYGQGEVIYCGEVSVGLDNGLGGASGLLYLGLNAANLPLMGGHLLVFPIPYAIPLVLDGPVGTPGVGKFEITTKAMAHGVSLYAQVFLNDPGAPCGASMSNGLELVFP